MNGESTINIQIDKELLEEIDKRAGKKGRSAFIRQAILEYLNKGPDPEIERIWEEINLLKKRIAELEEIKQVPENVEYIDKSVITKVCRDKIDEHILKYLFEQQAATTQELEGVVNLSRRMILERLKNMAQKINGLYSTTIIEHKRELYKGKRQAWVIIKPRLLMKPPNP